MSWRWCGGFHLRGLRWSRAARLWSRSATRLEPRSPRWASIRQQRSSYPAGRCSTVVSVGSPRWPRWARSASSAPLASRSRPWWPIARAYFQRCRYRRWFDPLDQLLRAGPATSTCPSGQPTRCGAASPTSACRDGCLMTACRTCPTRPGERARRVGQRAAGSQSGLAAGLTEFVEVGQINDGGRRRRLYSASSAGVRWLGCPPTCRAVGATRSRRRRCAEVCGRPRPCRISTTIATFRGLSVTGKAALADVLRSWLDRSAAPTLGDLGTFGGRAWLLIDLDAHRVALNADTKATIRQPQ
jgi:hypothetical protein